METLGEYLKLKQQDAGLSIETLSGITKIRPGFIEAIEKNDFSPFSSSQLLRGYVKLIVKTINADTEYALSLLETQIEESFKDRKVEDFVGNMFKEEKQKLYKLKRWIIITVLAGILLLILLVLSVRLYNFIKSMPNLFSVYGQKTLKTKNTGSSFNLNRRIGNQGSSKYTVTLVGKVTQKTWVAIKIDNEAEETYMLYPGDIKTWKAKKHIYIKIGNAGGISLTYNGKNLGKLGSEKEVETLNFPQKINSANKANKYIQTSNKTTG